MKGQLVSTGGAYIQTLLDDAEHWRSRAEETRTIAELMNDPETKRIMLDIADGYARLAEGAAERIADRTPDAVNFAGMCDVAHTLTVHRALFFVYQTRTEEQSNAANRCSE